METEVITALIAAAGAALGTFGGILASARLTTYRIQQLEIKVEKHNSVMERTSVLEEKIKVADHRIEDLELWRERKEG